MLFVDRQGNLRHIYRKHFLYETDKRWVTGPGPRFEYVDVDDARLGGQTRVHYYYHAFETYTYIICII